MCWQCHETDVAPAVQCMMGSYIWRVFPSLTTTCPALSPLLARCYSRAAGGLGAQQRGGGDGQPGVRGLTGQLAPASGKHHKQGVDGRVGC